MTGELRVQVAIGDTFFKAMPRVSKRDQKSVYEFVSKFRANPTSSGINYEIIRNAREPNYRSVRITQNYRGIVLKPDEGNVYILLWVDKHDDAYAWAERTRCNIHPATGALQLYEATIVQEDVLLPSSVETNADSDAGAAARSAEVEASPPVVDQAPPRPETLLLHVDPKKYLQFGVPEELVDEVADLRTSDELHAMQRRLPIEAYEALSFLADGESLDEVEKTYADVAVAPVDPTDFIAALARPSTQRRFHIFDNDDELLRMLNAPLSLWRTYLHASQRASVEWNVNGPIRILGGAGTGKTVVAMHRARWLVRDYLQRSDERVLFTTFTRNLAMDIEANLKLICSPEEMERIDVVNIDQWVSSFLKRQGRQQKIVYESGTDHTIDNAWKAAYPLVPDDVSPVLTPAFCREEWRRVVLPQNVRDVQAYFAADRTGRGVPLTRKQRALLWPVFDKVHVELARRDALTSEQAVYEAIQLLQEGKQTKRYAAIIIDETQDFGPEVMRLFRAIVPEAPNDMFIVGDAHQRIYSRVGSLSQSGIFIRGRSRKLRINYRTTEQIRRFAMQVLEGQPIDDLDGEDDGAKDYKSLFGGSEPQVKGFRTQRAEMEWLLTQARALVASEDAPMTFGDICVVARTHAEVERYRSALEELGAKTRLLTRQEADVRDTSSLRMATMHRVKGLEFKAVFLVGASEGNIPLHNAIESSTDAIERELAEIGERALFHVACTRAAQSLFVSWVGTQSRFLMEG